MKTNRFYIMAVMEAEEVVPVVVSEHIRYKTQKFNRHFYVKQLFGPTTQKECRAKMRRLSRV